MTRHEFAKRVRGPELLRELAGAGISPTLPDATPRVSWRDSADAPDADSRVWVECEPGELGAVAGVVEAHDADAYDAADGDRLTQYRQDKQRLRGFMQASNTSVTLLALVAVVKALARILIYKFRELEGGDE